MIRTQPLSVLKIFLLYLLHNCYVLYNLISIPMTLTSILITSIYQRLGCQHAKVNKTNQLSLCKRGPEYVERRIISSFTMICKSEKKSLCYLGSRNHPQRTSANFFLFFDTPSPLTHFCTFVTTLYDKTSFIDTPLDDSLFA